MIDDMSKNFQCHTEPSKITAAKILDLVSFSETAHRSVYCQ